MHAIRIPRLGGPEVLEPADLPDPAPGEGEALVELAAVGVNYIDTYFREGIYDAGLPLVPGLGTEKFGAQIWIQVGPYSFQPAEAAKVLLAVAFASYLVEKRDVLALAGAALTLGFVPDPVVVAMADVGACPGAGEEPPAPATVWRATTGEVVEPGTPLDDVVGGLTGSLDKTTDELLPDPD